VFVAALRAFGVNSGVNWVTSLEFEAQPLKRKEVDPLEYIENAFRDKSPNASGKSTSADSDLNVPIPSIDSYIATGDKPKRGRKRTAMRFKKTQLSAPRPRRAAKVNTDTPIDSDLQQVWQSLPKNIDFLFSFFDDKVTENYYRGNFKESRSDLIRRLLDPELTLEETSRLLGVCPATVRRYTNRKWLSHHRTKGGQRRFRLSDVVRFVGAHGRFPEG
jgi:excisionase family DNA binding protein